jgi:hypothetical protein
MTSPVLLEAHLSGVVRLRAQKRAVLRGCFLRLSLRESSIRLRYGIEGGVSAAWCSASVRVATEVCARS